MPRESDPRERMLRTARFALHLITVVLLVVTTARSAMMGAPLSAVMILGGLFLGWYGAGAAFIRGRGAIAWLIVLTGLWALMLVHSAEAVWMAFPLLLLAGHLLTLRWSVLFAVVVLGAVIAAPFMHGVEVTAAQIIGPIVGGSFSLAISLGYDALLRDAAERERLIASLIAAQHETQSLQDELAATQRAAGANDERTRLSRDLHDTIAQELSSMVMLARSGDAERMPQIETLAQHSLTDLRRIVAALAPRELEGSELPRALDRMVSALAAETDIAASFTAAEVPSLSTQHEVVLLRVAQSALANVRQHAQATEVWVALDSDADQVTLSIHDDGVGFAAGAPPASPSSYGLVAMRARLREVGGELTLHTAPGEGTQVVATVPQGESV